MILTAKKEKENKLKGQWVGITSTDNEGSNNGQLVVNIDEMYGHFSGSGFLIPATSKAPSTQFLIPISGKTSTAKIICPIELINQVDGEIIPPDVMEKKGILWSGSASVELESDKNRLFCKFQTDHTQGRATLYRPIDEDKKLADESVVKVSWSEFQERVSAYEWQSHAFRGQSNSNWKLVTAFHRTNRSDIQKLMNDAQRIAGELAANSETRFNLADPMQNGAFWYLLQHHGFPTPLLDWSYSPFVAAYFAFIERRRTALFAGSVRIHVFDIERWTQDFPQLVLLNQVGFHLSKLEALALGNRRSGPQMALSTVTNVVDIENYILDK